MITSALTENLIYKMMAYGLWYFKIKNKGKNLLFFYETEFQITMKSNGGRSENGIRAVTMTPGIKFQNKTWIFIYNYFHLYHLVLINFLVCYYDQALQSNS